MSSTDGSIEQELDADLYGSGSKFSDDSGIEDSWNEESSTMPSTASTKKQGEDNIDENTKLIPSADENPYPPFSQLTPPSEQCTEVYRPFNIYPTTSPESTDIVRCDVKDANAVEGVCGIENLGNTCFMNAGLQCIFASTLFQQAMLKEMSLGSCQMNPENSQSVVRMVDKFLEIFMKLISGEYAYLYPRDFHSALTQVLPLFGDRKQHDCQEFVSFLLNTLHDAFNRVSPLKKFSPIKEIRESSPQMSNLRLEGSSESENDDAQDTGEEVPKRMRMDQLDSEPDFGVECDERLNPAQTAWRNYVEQNRSLIVDTFQGQFKSMVTCEKCHHVSATFEPFMHVSVPIPHANEQQVLVTCRLQTQCVPNKTRLQTQRFVVTVSKNATVGNVKDQLMKAIKFDQKVEEEDLIMAEVANGTLLRTLVPDMGLQFLKLKENKQLYAIECLKMKPVENDPGLVKEVMGEDSGGVLPREGPTGWHTCGICLEDIFDDDLMIHGICGGVLCSDCLEATACYHSGKSFPCPVCNATVDEKSFSGITKSLKGANVKRTVLIPVLMRNVTQPLQQGQDASVSPTEKFRALGHPAVFLFPHTIKSSDIWQELKRIAPSAEDLVLSLVLTDAQGMSCSRCDTFADCSGCNIEDDDKIIQFKPGDHITISFQKISPELLKELSEVKDDVSVSSLRNGDMVKLGECFEYFCESEILGEENPWFCPKCRRNQNATKCISISRWPEVLIVHLKRFYFEGLQSAKVKSPVDFELNKFNLDLVCSTEALAKDSCIFDLTGIVCHKGSLTSGHYTAYCKHDNTWYFFNDETTCEADISSIQLEDIYMLFYQRAEVESAS
ncbi:ubiquitin carboxyl-terminal hydrolase 15-like [Rhopilema esculentum]|uniref:ubiquitin carboxyl-terminal hydrolase 15-like n=1 Tax=Rhopilema esculentum TaxID=499914 RepID=UPI0031D0B22B